jgi:TolB-like protein
MSGSISTTQQPPDPSGWRAGTPPPHTDTPDARTGEAAQPRPGVQTLCVLDFQRLGDDASVDWLEQGLADMMISVLQSDSPYLVIDRKHLREILQEHGLAQSGLVDDDTAVRQAHLTKAQLLLLGSFARQGDIVTIQVRLVRVADQHILAQVTWSDQYAKVLAAPQMLTQRLQASSGRSVDSKSLASLEVRIPRTIDVAESFYKGVRSFDEGRYPEALAHYLDASRVGDFTKAPAAVLEMYYLLGRSEHAVLFARERARLAEKNGNVSEAVEYYFAAARESLQPLRDPQLASELLRQLLRVIDRRDRRMREIAGTKRAILRRIDQLSREGLLKDPDRIRADREIRQRIWMVEIESELTRRSEEDGRGGYAVLEDGTWVKRFAPEPSLLMWRIRASRLLAHACAQLGDINTALDQYRDLLTEYEFLPAAAVTRLLDAFKTEAHFMMLRHYGQTGQLVRDHALNRINRLNLVHRGEIFTREFSAPAARRAPDAMADPGAALDARARVASRGERQGHEYFDFAAPPGQQIAALTLRIEVQGIAEVGFNVPQPTGWPPRYSLSKRFDHVKYSAPGRYERTVVPPPGTEFLSVGTSWGPGLFSNTLAEVMRYVSAGSNGPDIVKWEIAFVLSPKASQASIAASRPGRLTPAPRSLIDRYAKGWDRGQMVNAGDRQAYTGLPREDGFADEWLVFSLNDDIRIVHQKDVSFEIELPVAINSREREFDASLVRTHEGRYALLWSRGTGSINARRFVSFSDNLLRWDAPQRLLFEAPPQSLGYTYSLAEPLERSHNVVAVKDGYLMLLAQGFTRFSRDLRHWAEPRKALPQDLYRNRLLKGRDGVLWAVYETSSSQLQPYTAADWLHGSFVTDGKVYRHVTELRISRSVDGVGWDPAGEIVVPGQPSGLWAFQIDDRDLGIAVGFNNLYLKWFRASSLGALETIDADLLLPNHSDDASGAAFFMLDEGLTCVRPVFNVESQQPVLLSVTSERLFRERP